MLLSQLKRHPSAWVLSFFLLIQQMSWAFSIYLRSSCTVYCLQGDLQKAQERFFGAMLLLPLDFLFGTLTLLAGTWLFQRLYQGYCEWGFKEVLKEGPVFSLKDKEKILTWITDEAFFTLREVSIFPIWFLLSFLKLSLNFSIFFIQLGKGFCGLLLSVLGISLLLQRSFRRKISKLSLDHQKSRVACEQRVRGAWNWILFAGRYEALPTYKKLGATLELQGSLQRKTALLKAVCSLLPCSFLLALSLRLGPWVSSDSLKFYGACFNLLPELWSTLVSMHQLLGGMTDLYTLNAKLKTLYELPKHASIVPLGKRIHWEQLQWRDVVSNQPCPGLVSRLASGLEHLPQSGRWCLYGPNGSGKSSLLRWLKTGCTDACLLGPEIFLVDQKAGASSGERQMEQMKKLIREDLPPSVFLLDEWDAHLDLRHRQQMDRFLFRAAQKHKILEVRHCMADERSFDYKPEQATTMGEEPS